MLHVKITYTLELTPQEFRLVSAGLRGTLKPEWMEQAKELQNKLFEARNTQVQNLLGNIEKLAKE